MVFMGNLNPFLEPIVKEKNGRKNQVNEYRIMEVSLAIRRRNIWIGRLPHWVTLMFFVKDKQRGVFRKQKLRCCLVQVLNEGFGVTRSVKVFIF